MADNITSWIIGGRHETVHFPPPLLHRHSFNGRSATLTPGGIHNEVLRYSLAPRLSPLLDGALLSRYPPVKGFPAPSLYWHAAASLQKHLPHKVSHDVKHKINRSPTTISTVSVDTRTSGTPATRARIDSDDSIDTKNKRTGRKCKFEGCLNSVVQGGLCISHGAKRKQCAHPGCTKNVKKAGMCSAHGPARKKCEHADCCNIAVQGGLCIAHGAKKRLCCHVGCTKKARSAWNHMCKRHFDDKNQSSSRQNNGSMLPALLALGGVVPSTIIADTHCYPVVTRAA